MAARRVPAWINVHTIAYRDVEHDHIDWAAKLGEVQRDLLAAAERPCEFDAWRLAQSSGETITMNAESGDNAHAN